MNGKKPRILHLEDEPGWTRKVEEYLAEKYDVIATASLPHAKDLLSKEDFDLAIVDISLVPQEGSDTGGFQFVSYVRSSDLWLDLPIVILTGYDSMEKMRVAFKEFRVSDFLAKDKIDRRDFQTFITQAIATGPRSYAFSEPFKALVIEDNPQWQSRLSRILEEEGCQVDTASTYGEAINQLTSEVYHLATVDIRLKDLDSADARGVELVDMIRRLRNSADVIFISGYGTLEQMRRAAFDLGARDFMDKGDFQPQHFRLRVRKILRHLIYMTVDVGAGEDTPILRVGEKHPLKISVSRTRPKRGFSRSLTRPVTVGQFEMEVVVQPWDVDILPGSTQHLLIRSDDTTEQVEFEIIPVELGRAELTIDFLYRSNMLARMLVVCKVVE